MVSGTISCGKFITEMRPDGLVSGQTLHGRGCQKQIDIPLSFPKMKMKTDCNPNRLRKYHDRLETHCTSRSRVATPDCNIDLNRRVKGNGSFTIRTPVSIYAYKSTAPAVCVPLIRLDVRLTNNESRKESLYPPHDQRLWYHHHHIPLHHPHHSLHGRRIRHWIPRRLPSLLRLLEEFAFLVAINEVIAFRVESSGADGRVV